MIVQKVSLCLFHCKPKPSGASLESPGLENIPQLPGNRADVGQNHDLRKVVSATLLVLKWSGAIFRARSPKMSVQKLLLCSFHCKPRPSGVSLASPRQENMPQGPGYWAEVGQNHDAPKVLSTTLSVLKWGGALFRARSPKVSVQKVLLCPFHCKPRPSGLSLESSGLKNIAQVPGNRTETDQKSRCSKCGLGYCFSVKVKCGYISAHKLESERSKSFAVSISLQNKAIRT